MRSRHAPMPVRMLSDRDLRKKGIRFSRQHRHRLIAKGKFPAPVKLGDATVAWVESKIDARLETKTVERDRKLKSETEARSPAKKVDRSKMLISNESKL
jgi:prophage regulatory protein